MLLLAHVTDTDRGYSISSVTLWGYYFLEYIRKDMKGEGRIALVNIPIISGAPEIVLDIAYIVLYKLFCAIQPVILVPYLK